jgi:hypothetical protein
VRGFIGGGRPDHYKEVYLIKDGDGYIAGEKKYILDNPDLFKYIGYQSINSTRSHFYEFVN